MKEFLDEPPRKRQLFLSQIYARIPKHLIHDNANLLILFKQDGTNLKHVYNDHVPTCRTTNFVHCAMAVDNKNMDYF